MDRVTVTMPEGGQAASGAGEHIIEVEDLKVHFPVRAGFFKAQVGTVKAVDGVTFDVRRGETLAWSASRAAARARPVGP